MTPPASAPASSPIPDQSFGSLKQEFVKVTAEIDLSDTLTPGDRPLLWPYWTVTWPLARDGSHGQAWRPSLALGGLTREKGPGRIYGLTIVITHKGCTGMSNHIHAQTWQVKLRDCYSYLYIPQTEFALCLRVCAQACVCVCASQCVSVCLCMCVCTHWRSRVRVHACVDPCAFASTVPSHFPSVITRRCGRGRQNSRTRSLAHTHTDAKNSLKLEGGKHIPRTRQSPAPPATGPLSLSLS